MGATVSSVLGHVACRDRWAGKLLVSLDQDVRYRKLRQAFQRCNKMALLALRLRQDMAVSRPHRQHHLLLYGGLKHKSAATFTFVDLPLWSMKSYCYRRLLDVNLG